MKKMTSIIVAIFMIATNALIAQNAVGEVPSLPFGSMQKIEAYAVSNVYAILIWTDYYNTNGTWKPFINSVLYIPSPLTNKWQMDQTITALKLSNILSNLLVRTNQYIDKNRGIRTYTQCRMGGNGQSSISFSTPYIYITPNKIGGVYSVPDLSWFKMTMKSDLPIYIPGTTWVRMEIGYWGDPFPFEVLDRRLDPSTDVLHSDGFIYLPVDVVTDSSSATGTYQLKMSVFSSSTGFQSFNGDGRLLPETPMRTGIASSGSTVTVTVRGGDSGRAYFLQQSSNLKNWTNVGEVNIVSPLAHYFPKGGSESFVIPKTNVFGYFRTVTAEVSPY